MNTVSNIEHNTPVRLADQVEHRHQAEEFVKIARTNHGEADLLALDKDVVIPEHQVNAVAIATVLEGKVEFSVGEARHEMAAGDAIILNPHQKHSVRALESSKIYLVRINA